MFRLSTRNLFLTYPHYTHDKEALLLYLAELLTTYGPHIRVARELHEDGSPHMHAFIRLERKCSTRNERYFDHLSRHPNIVSRIKDLQATFDYVSKGGDYIDHGKPEPDVKKKWSDLVNCTTAAEFWTTAPMVSPRDFVLNRERLISFAEWKFPAATTGYVSSYPQESFNAPQELLDWQQQAFNYEVSAGGAVCPPIPP